MMLAIFFVSFTELYRVMLAKLKYCHHLNNLICHAIGATRHLIHSTLQWGTGWSEKGRGREVMFAAAWRELALREREMIWSCADSWDHKAWLPAAAWQIQREGKSDAERHLQTPNTPSSLLIISNWASGSNYGREGRQRACASSQWNAKWTLCYIFRCFVEGWQAFRGAAALGDTIPELKQLSFPTTVSWLIFIYIYKKRH